MREKDERETLRLGVSALDRMGDEKEFKMEKERRTINANKGKKEGSISEERIRNKR